jgi:hypothetical protein
MKCEQVLSLSLRAKIRRRFRDIAGWRTGVDDEGNRMVFERGRYCSSGVYERKSIHLLTSGEELSEVNF